MSTTIALLAWFTFGLIGGGLAWAMIRSRHPLGAVTPLSLGITGAMLGGLLGWMSAGSPMHPMSWVFAILAGVLVPSLYTFVANRREIHR